MEFKKGTPGLRRDRRICPRCQVTSGQRSQCPKCDSKTEPRIEIVWYVNKKRYRELTHFWREQDAAAVLQRKENDYWRQQELGVDREVGGTLGEGFEAFMSSITCSASYQKQINTAMNALVRGFGWDASVTLVNARDIEQFKQDGLASLATTTVHTYMLVLRRFFSYLHNEGWIRRNPTHKVKLPPARCARDHLRPEEVGPVLQAFWETAPVIAPAITAFILGGWRRGELINLRRRDVNLQQRWAYVLEFEGDEFACAWSPKTESSRRAIPLHPLVVRAFSKVKPVICPDGQLSPWMFPIADQHWQTRTWDKNGRPRPVCGDRRALGTASFGNKLHEVLAQTGIKRRVTVHGLRRTFAVLLQEAGASDAVIRQALGHSGRGVTEMHYLPRRDAAIQRWVDAINVDVPALAA